MCLISTLKSDFVIHLLLTLTILTKTLLTLLSTENLFSTQLKLQKYSNMYFLCPSFCLLHSKDRFVASLLYLSSLSSLPIPLGHFQFTLVLPKYRYTFSCLFEFLSRHYVVFSTEKIVVVSLFFLTFHQNYYHCQALSVVLTKVHFSHYHPIRYMKIYLRLIHA